VQCSQRTGANARPQAGAQAVTLASFGLLQKLCH
jgi:hypothetical protein